LKNAKGYLAGYLAFVLGPNVGMGDVAASFGFAAGFRRHVRPCLVGTFVKHI
jgi:hypothetical protein